MNPGKLDKRITIEHEGGYWDDDGVWVEGWTEFATVWAAREPLTGREFFAAAFTHAEFSLRFRIRYRKDITTLMRIVCDGRIYEIYAVLDGVAGGRTETHLMAKETV